MTTEKAQNRIIELLSEIDRPGISAVIDFIKSSNYLTTAKCYKHHRRQYGLMMHSLEVCDTMLKLNGDRLPRESIIISALFHDLGKATVDGKKIGLGGHPERSIAILRKCGFQLTPQEQSAICNHHPGSDPVKVAAAVSNPLQLLLHAGDCRSTGIDKRGNTYRFSKI